MFASWLRCAATAAPRTLLAEGGLRCSWRALASQSRQVPSFAWRGLPPKSGYMPRAEEIKEEHIGGTFLVHSGKDYKKVKVTTQMVMHKFGEFVLT